MHKVAFVVAVLGSVPANGAPAAKAHPTVAFGTPTVSGAIDAKAIAAVVKTTTAKLLACVTAAEVDATVTFTIGGDGRVTNAETTGTTDRVAACITATISKLKFAASKQTTGVVYPLAFKRTVDPDSPTAILGALPPNTAIFGDGSTEDDTVYGGVFGVTAGSNGMYNAGTTARIGTGHGAHVGTPTPMVSTGEEKVTGNLDRPIIRRYIRRNLPKLQSCYERELQTIKTLRGTVTAEFTITAEGAVGSSTASGMNNTNVESCVASVIQAIEFPKPRDASDVKVSYPFTFHPPAKPR